MNDDLVKALLRCYPDIGNTIRSINKRIRHLVNCGYYVHYLQDEMRIYVKIIELNARKQGLKNLRYVIRNVLLSSKDVTRILLIDKYLKGKSAEWIAKKYKLSIRTVYRNLNRAYIDIKRVLIDLNFTEQMIQDYFGDEPIFINALKEVKNERTRKARKGD